MKKIATSHPDVWELAPDVFQDERGWFLETYSQQRFADFGISETFVQDNHSQTLKEFTLRGLHYQIQHQQAKLCRVIEGEVLDVAVDIRVGSPNFGKAACVVLTAEKKNMIFIPKGFAHGFMVTKGPAQFLYKCSDFYSKADERGVLWSDPALGIEWGTTDPMLHVRDAMFPVLADVPGEDLPVYGR
ncbi:MAG: dTDP-4-dehydrorhamnose 3,5-epimerase [Bryobacteraceae bacterium]